MRMLQCHASGEAIQPPGKILQGAVVVGYWQRAYSRVVLEKRRIVLKRRWNCAGVASMRFAD